MSWDLKNVSLDPKYAMQRRTASRMEMEPTIAGVRVRLRQTLTISDEAADINGDRIDLCVKHGVLTAKHTNAAPTPTTMRGQPKVTPLGAVAARSMAEEEAELKETDLDEDLEEDLEEAEAVEATPLSPESEEQNLRLMLRRGLEDAREGRMHPLKLDDESEDETESEEAVETTPVAPAALEEDFPEPESEDASGFSSMTVEQLRVQAIECGIELPSRIKRDDIIAILESAEEQE